MFRLKTGCGKNPVLAVYHVGFREQRIIITPQQFFFQVAHPFTDNLLDRVTDRKEKRRERLAKFCVHFPGILEGTAARQISML